MVPLPPRGRAAPEVTFVYFARGRHRSRQFVGDTDGSLANFQVAIDLDPTYGCMGRTDDAEWYMFEYEALGHTATVSAVMASMSNEDDAYRADFREALRLAGMPD